MTQDESKPRYVMLKETRQSRGISIDTVHEATKIPMDVLKSIEEGYLVKTMSPFYFRQFVKMYAQYMGVDVKDVLEDYKRETLPAAKKIRPSSEEIQIQLGNFFTRRRQQQIVIGAGILLCVLVVVKVATAFRARQADAPAAVKVAKPKAVKPAVKKKPVEKPKVVVPEKKAVEEKESPAAPEPKAEAPAAVVKAAPSAARSPAPAVQPKPSPVAVVPSAKGVHLTVLAKKKCWLQVKVDGAVVFQSTLEKGNVETWHGDNAIELAGNNIMSLEFEVNGKTLGALGRDDSRARKLVVTKDGLSVKK